MAKSEDRVAPKRIRVTGLQEAQIQRVVAFDEASSAAYYELGFDSAAVPVKSGADLARLARTHSVKVAEADHDPAGVIAWRDEAPGVAYLAEISVDPEYQRFGVGSRMMEALFEEARGLGLAHVVVRCWKKAGFAMGFYAHHGFQPIDAAAPVKVQGWLAEQESGKPATRPGEVALWATIPQPEPPADDDDDSAD